MGSTLNVVLSERGAGISLRREPLPKMPEELKALLPRESVMPTYTMRVFGATREAVSSRTIASRPGKDGRLDVIHRIQATQAPDLACRWNCKAGKCGSCSAEVNGTPRLMCMTRMNLFADGETVSVAPIARSRSSEDLVTDVSYNFEKAKQVPPLRLRPPDPDGKYRMRQEDVDRPRSFTSVLSASSARTSARHPRPRGQEADLRRASLLHQDAGLDMHPLDTRDRSAFIRDRRESTLQHHQVLHEVCPEHIHITDNGIIPSRSGWPTASTPSCGSCENSGGNRPAGSGVTALRDREVSGVSEPRRT